MYKKEIPAGVFARGSGPPKPRASHSGPADVVIPRRLPGTPPGSLRTTKEGREIRRQAVEEFRKGRAAPASVAERDALSAIRSPETWLGAFLALIRFSLRRAGPRPPATEANETGGDVKNRVLPRNQGDAWWPIPAYPTLWRL